MEHLDIIVEFTKEIQSKDLPLDKKGSPKQEYNY